MRKNLKVKHERRKCSFALSRWLFSFSVFWAFVKKEEKLFWRRETEKHSREGCVRCFSFIAWYQWRKMTTMTSRVTTPTRWRQNIKKSQKNLDKSLFDQLFFIFKNLVSIFLFSNRRLQSQEKNRSISSSKFFCTIVIFIENQNQLKLFLACLLQMQRNDVKAFSLSLSLSHTRTH